MQKTCCWDWDLEDMFEWELCSQVPSLEIVFLMLFFHQSSWFALSKALELVLSKPQCLWYTRYCQGSTITSFITSFIHFLLICFQRTVTCHSNPPSILLAKNRGGWWMAGLYNVFLNTLSKLGHFPMSTIHPNLQPCLRWKWMTPNLRRANKNLISLITSSLII